MLSGISYDPQDNKPETRLYSNYYLFFAQRYTDVPATAAFTGWATRWNMGRPPAARSTGSTC